MPAHEVWESTDVRDSGFHRVYSIVGFDELDMLRGGHHTLLVCLACPGGNVRRDVLVDRVRTTDVRRDARDMIAMLSGHDGADRDRSRNLRNRVDLIRRDVGEVELVLGVAYGERLPTQPRVLPTPTPEMLDRVRDELLHQGGYGGFRWHLATQLDELPEPPHPRALLCIVGIDARGRINGSLPRPNHHQIDLWFKRDLRQVCQGVIEHDLFRETVKCAERRGEQIAFLWRYERPQRAAA